jgi:HEAT repeat protein
MSENANEQTLALAVDTGRPTYEREQAIHELGKTPTPDVVNHLIKLLEDNDDGIRWTASSALIECGDAALKPMLQALLDQHDSVWLRRGAYRVFHDTKSLKVQQATEEVIKALNGPAAESMTTDAAARALMKLM